MISAGFVVMAIRQSIQCCESETHGKVEGGGVGGGDGSSVVLLVPTQDQDTAANVHTAEDAKSTPSASCTVDVVVVSHLEMTSMVECEPVFCNVCPVVSVLSAVM